LVRFRQEPWLLRVAYQGAYEELTFATEALDEAPETAASRARGRIGGGVRDGLLRRMLAVGDVVAVTLAIVVLSKIERPGIVTAAMVCLVLPIWIVLAKLHGLYDGDRHALRHLSVDEASTVFRWAMVGTIATMVVLEVLPTREMSFGTAVFVALLVGTSAFAFRCGMRWLWRAITERDRVVVLGEDTLAEAVRRKLLIFDDIHATLVGVRATWESDPDTYERDLVDIDRVIVASPSIDESMLAPLIAHCRRHRIKLTVVPPTRGMFGTAVQLGHVADLPVVEFNTGDASASTLLLKRVFDIVVSAIALVALAPVFIAIAIAIRLDSRGTAIFRQTRAGRDGTAFTMYKFRTMVAEAEDMLADLLSFDHLREPVFKFQNDPRITRVGRVLRRTSLDELPQLVNILKGDMSIVGPRPEQADLVARYSEAERVRLSVKPGLTGPMQVSGRGHLTLEERLAVEREYIENLSLGRDLMIIALTLSPLISGKGAF
jgi:exopolysaccharide biosynthesis polyprenyl glycosylphosphotransferase